MVFNWDSTQNFERLLLLFLISGSITSKEVKKICDILLFFFFY